MSNIKVTEEFLVRFAMFVLSCIPCDIPLPDIRISKLVPGLKGAFAVDILKDQPEGHIIISSRYCGDVEGILTVFLTELARYLVWYDGYVHRDRPDKDGGPVEFDEMCAFLGLETDGRGGYRCPSISLYVTKMLEDI